MKDNKLKILYYITRWYEGTAYKNINFMRDNFGGEIVKEDITAGKDYIKEAKPEFMVVRGDNRDDYKMAIRHNLPYLLIEHDINGLRQGKITGQEKERIENASAIILTSKDHAKYFQYLKEKKGWKIPFFEVIHTRPLKKDIDYEPRQKLEGLNLVYAGGVVVSWMRRNSSYGYRCYHEIFRAFIEAGWKVHIYSASYNTGKLWEYKDIGCILHQNLPYKALLQEMSQYTAGFHGYNKEGVPEQAYGYTKLCRGNKIWDYLAAGIPTIGYQGGNGMKIYEGKWGIIINDLEKKTLKGIPKKLAKIKISERIRKANVMDKDIRKYRKLVDIVLKDAGSKKREIIKAPDITDFKDNMKLPNRIKVYNKGVKEVYRGGYIFPPRKMTEELAINVRTYKEIKSHVSLIIEIIK